MSPPEFSRAVASHLDTRGYRFDHRHLQEYVDSCWSVIQIDPSPEMVANWFIQSGLATGREGQ